VSPYEEKECVAHVRNVWRDIRPLSLQNTTIAATVEDSSNEFDGLSMKILANLPARFIWMVTRSAPREISPLSAPQQDLAQQRVDY
jgi:hypothetical protein